MAEPLTGQGRVARRARWRALGHTTLLLSATLSAAVLVAGCTAAPAHHAAATSPAGPTSSPALAAITSAIDAINATAGGPVEAQRAVLQQLAAPAEQQEQRSCPAAHSTLAFQPAYRDLRVMPRSFDTDTPATPTPVAGAAPTDGGAGHEPSTSPSARAGRPATGYLLPTFITIYTGDRITGTDLATLRLWVSGGVARIGALCVS